MDYEGTQHLSLRFVVVLYQFVALCACGRVPPFTHIYSYEILTLKFALTLWKTINKHIYMIFKPFHLTIMRIIEENCLFFIWKYRK